MDAFTKLKHEKYLRETVIPEATQIFHTLRVGHAEADPYELARHAGFAALSNHSAAIRVTNQAEGEKLAQSYMRMCEANFAVEIQNLPKPVVEAVN